MYLYSPEPQRPGALGPPATRQRLGKDVVVIELFVPKSARHFLQGSTQPAAFARSRINCVPRQHGFDCRCGCALHSTIDNLNIGNQRFVNELQPVNILADRLRCGIH